MDWLGRHINRIGIGLAMLLSLFQTGGAEARDFVVVIDAGHGGHDPGAVGKSSKEKNINLQVALSLGRRIEAGCPDVKVIYTRRKDVFIPLNRRAEIANNANADLFISVHTNALASNHTACGSSTWTLGLAKSAENLNVAKRENSVILYEDDYRERYAGFNPNSSESYIIFEFMQDKYMSQSVHLASLVQQQFKDACGRSDHGVHQAGFLVLKASAMPSILIELGYISTLSEERYLNSEEGITSLSEGIYRAFLAYKEEQQAQQQAETLAGGAKASQQAGAAEGGLVFKVQIVASASRIDKDSRLFRGLEEVDSYEEKGWYKYTCGSTPDYEEALRLRRSLALRFKDAFVVAFKDGKRTDINAAIREFKRLKK